MKPQKVGTYVFAGIVGELWAVPDTGGSGVINWTVKPALKVEVGVDGSWERTVSILIHECLEVCMHALQVAYDTSTFAHKQAPDTDSYVFHMDHKQFAYVVDHAADVVTFALPKLEKIWKQAHRKGK